jgi:hypothetical protein
LAFNRVATFAATFAALVKDFTNAPMNYGTDIRAVGSMALAAGVSPSRAIARVRTYYHPQACNTLH